VDAAQTLYPQLERARLYPRQNAALPTAKQFTMTSSKLSPLDRGELTKILNLYCICVEAVVKAYRAPSVTSFRRNKQGSRFWEVYLSEDIIARGDRPEEAEDDLVLAYKEWCLCDHFCSMLYKALRRHLRSESIYSISTR
jgi:hypothetical protein